jgi:hypothetical protein
LAYGDARGRLGIMPGFVIGASGRHCHCASQGECEGCGLEGTANEAVVFHGCLQCGFEDVSEYASSVVAYGNT